MPATSTVSSPESIRTVISSVKSGETVSVVSISSMPRSSATVGALTRLTGSSVCPERIPTSVEIPSRRVSCSARRPRTSTSTRSTDSITEPLGQSAELLAERDERRQGLHGLGPDRGDVDRVGDDAAGQRGRDLLGGDDAGAVLRLGGRGSEVRGRRRRRRGRRADARSSARRGRRRGRPLRPCPSRAPPARASRSISSPRAQLTIRTPSFIFASASASIQLIVSGVFGRWIVIRSARP